MFIILKIYIDEYFTFCSLKVVLMYCLKEEAETIQLAMNILAETFLGAEEARAIEIYSLDSP